MPNKLIFFFIGKPQHGKTTSSKYIASKTGLKSESTSKLVYKILAQELGISEESARALPKESVRAQMVIIGDRLCAVSKTALVDGLIEDGFPIVDGIRRRAELRESVAGLEAKGYKVVVVWINNPRTPPIQDNTGVLPEDAKFHVENDGTFDELYAKLDVILAQVS